MNPIQLKGDMDGQTFSVWACGACRMAARDEAFATACCTPTVCSRCAGPVEKHWTACKGCRDAADAEKRAAAVRDAKTIPWHDPAVDGMVYVEDEDDWIWADTLVDKWQDECPEELLVLGPEAEYIPGPCPWLVWLGVPNQFTLDAGSIIERAMEDHTEGIDDPYAFEVSDDAVTELQALLDGWVAKVKVPSTFMVSKTRVDLTGLEA